MFAAVNEEKHVLGLQVVRQRLGHGTIRLFRDVEGRGDAVGHERRIGKRGQFDEPYPIGELLKRISRRPEGQAGLAATARARQRQKPRRAEQLHDLAISPSRPIKLVSWVGRLWRRRGDGTIRLRSRTDCVSRLLAGCFASRFLGRPAIRQPPLREIAASG
jgi:hypothetical protein